MTIRDAALAALAWVLVAAGCDPTPQFPPVVPPPPGLIRSEVEVVPRTAETTTVNLDYDVKVSIPSGAAPDGTRMTLRLLVGVGVERGPAELVAPINWVSFDRRAALQVLPESLVLARPATLTVSSFPAPVDGYRLCPVVLFALADDAEWQVVGPATVGASSFGFGDLSASVDRGGLWSLAYLAACPTFDGGVDAQRD